jgi:rod shape-determining protein MreD
MRLFLLYFLIGLFLILLQSTFFSLLPLGPIVPDLILVLCVYLGLHHPTVGAALGSFVLGYSVDVVSSRLLGFNAFAMTLVFLAVYFSSRSIWLHHPVVSSLIVLCAAVVKGVAMVLVWVIFLSMEGFWLGAVNRIPPEEARSG